LDPEFLRALEDRFLYPVFLPVLDGINDDFGKTGQANIAAKLYLLFYDTDIDLILFTGGSRTTGTGWTFPGTSPPTSRSMGIRLHRRLSKRYIDSKGNILSSTYDTASYLLGVRYLSQRETTYILEYYRNGTGFSKDEFQDFYRLIDRAYDQYLTTGNSALLGKAQNLSQGNYGRPNNGQDYLYLRVSQKEPFDILYFTPSLTTIINLRDPSLSIAPECLHGYYQPGAAP